MFLMNRTPTYNLKITFSQLRVTNKFQPSTGLEIDTNYIYIYIYYIKNTLYGNKERIISFSASNWARVEEDMHFLKLIGHTAFFIPALNLTSYYFIVSILSYTQLALPIRRVENIVCEIRKETERMLLGPVSSPHRVK